jgi:hypothetical protein
LFRFHCSIPKQVHVKGAAQLTDPVLLRINGVDIGNTSGRNGTRSMAWELFLVVGPDMMKAVVNVSFFIAREAGKLGSPSWFQLESDTGCQEDGGRQLGRKISLKGILLKSQIAEEFPILLDIFGDLFNEIAALPHVIVKANAF